MFERRRRLFVHCKENLRVQKKCEPKVIGSGENERTFTISVNGEAVVISKDCELIRKAR